MCPTAMALRGQNLPLVLGEGRGGYFGVVVPVDEVSMEGRGK